MISYDFNTVRSYNLDQAWRNSINLCTRNGQNHLVVEGSYSGQARCQLENFQLIVTHPGDLPLAPIVPPGLPAPTTEAEIQQYFINYLIGYPRANQAYTYGEFILPALDEIIFKLSRSRGGTNQATINIGNESSLSQTDPPCLRALSFKLVNGALNLFSYWRSWDLFAAFPTNLGGLQILKNYVAEQVNDFVPCADGKLIAFSDGLHIYEQYFELVNQLSIDKIS